MKIKKGDKVIVISGHDKGVVGEVTKVLPEKEKVVVSGVNVAKKSLKPTQANPDGGIIEQEMPIHVSNVAAYDEKAKKASKIGYKEVKGKKTRVYKKTGAVVK